MDRITLPNGDLIEITPTIGATHVSLTRREDIGQVAACHINIAISGATDADIDGAVAYLTTCANGGL